MSLFDKLKSMKKQSTRQLIGVASIEDCCLTTGSGEKLAYLILSPVNLSILPSAEIKSKINRFTTVLEAIGTSEYLCINSAQSYEHNKRYLAGLKSRERNQTLKDLDEKDIRYLDDIQVKMATGRQFLTVLRFGRKDSTDSIFSVLTRAKQILKANGFTARIASREDIKRCLAIYLEQDIFDDTIQDFDGERYAGILEMTQ